MRGVVVLLAVAVLGTGAHASPLRLYGFGGASSGTAGAGVATTAGFESSFLNPAGLAYVTTRRVTLGEVYGRFSLTLDGERSAIDPAHLRVAGIATPIPFAGPWRDRVGFAIGLYVPHDTLNKAQAPFPGTPAYTLLANTTRVISINVGVGARLGGGWSVGLGVITLATLTGGIHITSDAAGRFVTKSEQNIVTHFAPVVGARKRLGDDLELGAVVRATSRSGYDVLVTNELGDALPLQLPELLVAGVAQYDPFTVAAEVAWRASPAWRLSGQLAYERWSAFPLPTATPTRTVDGEERQQPPEFHDTAVPRLGAVWQASDDVELRAGYAFHLSPAPEMDGEQSLLDNHRHVVALGAGGAWTDWAVPVYVDAWVQLHALMPRTHTKDPSRFGDPDDIPFESIDTGGWLWATGLAIGVGL